MKDVEVYISGLVHCSVCAAKALSEEQIIEAVNAANPTGLSHGWHIDDAPTFASGEPNPCPCEQFPHERVHYLMVC